MDASGFIDHVLNEHLTDSDAVMVAQSGQIDAPEGWELVCVTYCNGKRIRLYKMKGEE